jgi:hypothetical protein
MIVRSTIFICLWQINDFLKGNNYWIQRIESMIVRSTIFICLFLFEKKGLNKKVLLRKTTKQQNNKTIQINDFLKGNNYCAKRNQ